MIAKLKFEKEERERIEAQEALEKAMKEKADQEEIRRL